MNKFGAIASEMKKALRITGQITFVTSAMPLKSSDTIKITRYFSDATTEPFKFKTKINQRIVYTNELYKSGDDVLFLFLKDSARPGYYIAGFMPKRDAIKLRRRLPGVAEYDARLAVRSIYVAKSLYKIFKSKRMIGV